MLDSTMTARVTKIPGQMSLILVMAFRCERLYSRSDWQQGIRCDNISVPANKERNKTTGFWGLLCERAEVAGRSNAGVLRLTTVLDGQKRQSVGCEVGSSFNRLAAARQNTR